MKDKDSNGAGRVRGPENEIFTLLASPEVWEPGLVLSDRPLPRASTGRSKARKVKKARKVTRAARRKNRGK